VGRAGTARREQETAGGEIWAGRPGRMNGIGVDLDRLASVRQKDAPSMAQGMIGMIRCRWKMLNVSSV